MASITQRHVGGSSAGNSPRGLTPKDRRKLEIASVAAFPLVLGFIPLVLQRWLGPTAIGALNSFVALSQSALIFFLQTRSSSAFSGSSSTAAVEVSNFARSARRLSVEGAICFACCLSTLLMLQLFGSSFETSVLMLQQAKQLSATTQGYNILCTTFYGMTVFMVWLPATGLFARSAKRKTLLLPSYWFFFGIAAASLACMRLVNYGKELFSGLPVQNVLGFDPLLGVPNHWATALVVTASVGMFILLTLAQALFMWTVARFTRLDALEPRP